MRLTAFIPTVGRELVVALEACGIQTDSDLLFSAQPLELFLRLPEGTATLQELVQFRTLVAEAAAAPSKSGSELFEEHLAFQDPIHKVSGVFSLDALLESLVAPQIIHISGDRGAGKSAFALNVALRMLAEHDNSNVLWIDTTGDFSPTNAKRVLEYTRGQQPDNSPLERLQVSLLFDNDTLYTVLEEHQMTYEHTPTRHSHRCVVIDTITPLLGPLLSAESAHGHATMVSTIHHLRDYARQHSVLVLLVNNATLAQPNDYLHTVTPTTKKPALGPSFTFLTDATIWISACPPPDNAMEDDSSTFHSAQLIASKNTQSDQFSEFRLRDGTILPPLES
ncbi:P-loop containing nucleoside triphosphate hydrolase protein [Pluteus cervinus]|uniref:P-loop containing nucleoside triphosphate hydrolase protein n=1 Tax=Pluteus cervinus TaxID=181527 RepID=A0ACD3BB49_9AGAR|nr:P-loop containing nucleoside triphosphate hydrolase protein [Pluteus cervinus]